MRGGPAAIVALGAALVWGAAPAAAQVSLPNPRVAASRIPAPDPVRVVVIDPGHGGYDPGSVGPGGVEEKEVALAVGLALARALDTVPDLEVHLTRDRDVSIPIWERGDMATRLKGDRPGVLVSIHVNSLDDANTRGVETYFLSQARTEHERRVAALENSPPAGGGDGGAARTADPGLAFILNELRNLDYMHWSADLAAEVQRHLAEVHPGRNRGVKQAPLAVITNALMPGVLVELGFVSNRAEERLLADPDFHGEAADALARAVVEFFERYPPRAGGSGGGGR
ncbi:MAG: N-acetylmuramoyl-L-alanine amidase [Longimicrobiales bacterium]